MLSIQVGDVQEMTAAMGNGPVHALDTALRKALSVFYPELSKVRLVDYKVRVLTGKAATASRVRVLIESSDGELDWTTTGVIHGYHRGQLGSAVGFDRILSASKGGLSIMSMTMTQKILAAHCGKDAVKAGRYDRRHLRPGSGKRYHRAGRGERV